VLDVFHLSYSVLLHCQFPSVIAALALSSEEVWENAMYSWPWGGKPAMVYIYIFQHFEASALEPYFIGNLILVRNCILHRWKEMVGCDILDLGYKDSFG
jgi:hypothetical protein